MTLRAPNPVPVPTIPTGIVNLPRQSRSGRDGSVERRRAACPRPPRGVRSRGPARPSCSARSAARRGSRGGRSSRFPARSGGSRPGSTTPTRQAWFPGFMSRSMPNSAAWPPAYGKNVRSFPSTEPSTVAVSATSFTRTQATSPMRGFDGCQVAGPFRQPRTLLPSGRGRALRERARPGSLRALLAEELLDLGDELGGRREVALSARGRGCGVLGVARLQLLDVVGDLVVLGRRSLSGWCRTACPPRRVRPCRSWLPRAGPHAERAPGLPWGSRSPRCSGGRWPRGSPTPILARGRSCSARRRYRSAPRSGSDGPRGERRAPDRRRCRTGGRAGCGAPPRAEPPGSKPARRRTSWRGRGPGCSSVFHRR